MAAFKGPIPVGVVEAIKANKCLLFVGAGLSAGAVRPDGRPLPLWRELLEELIGWAVKNSIINEQYAELISQIILKGDLLKAAQALQNKLNQAQLCEFLDLVFKEVPQTKAHCLLPEIPFKAVLTTNYDKLLEGAYTKANDGELPTVFTQKDLAGQAYRIRDDKFYIFKLHGDIDRPDTIVLGSRDYRDLFNKYPEYRDFLKTLFLTHTVLFVGFGDNDPDIDELLNNLSAIFDGNNQPHYILLPTGSKNEIEKELLLKDKRLVVIDYSLDENGGHSQVTGFLQDLREQCSLAHQIHYDFKIFSKNQIIETQEDEVRVLWLLPRGFLIFENFSSYSVTVHYYDYRGNLYLGAFYNETCSKICADEINRISKNLTIPETDWDYCVEPLYFMMKAYEYKGEDMEDFIRRYIDNKVYFYPPGKPIYLPEVPVIYKFLCESGSIRDIIVSINQDKLKDLRDDVLKARAIEVQQSSYLEVINLITERHPAIKYLKKILDEYNTNYTRKKTLSWFTNVHKILETTLKQIEKERN